MKPALHFIWSPFLFAVLGMIVAWKIADVAPREMYFTNGVIQFKQLTNFNLVFLALIALPLGGLIVGWLLAYLATPIKTREATS